VLRTAEAMSSAEPASVPSAVVHLPSRQIIGTPYKLKVLALATRPVASRRSPASSCRAVSAAHRHAQARIVHVIAVDDQPHHARDPRARRRPRRARGCATASSR
jgi:hypothetical protein